MSPFGLKFSQMILPTETSKLMYNRSFFFVVLHKPTLLPSTFKLYYHSDFQVLYERLMGGWNTECFFIKLYYHSDTELGGGSDLLKTI